MKTGNIKIIFAPSFPSHSEHSDAQLCYIDCSATAFIGWIKAEYLTSFSSHYKFSSLLPVQNFIFKLVGGKNFSSKCIETILYDYDYISLQFLLYFSFDNPIIVPIYSFAVVQILRNLHENEFSVSIKAWVSIRQTACCSL